GGWNHHHPNGGAPETPEQNLLPSAQVAKRPQEGFLVSVGGKSATHRKRRDARTNR
ncbi:hypothetical protein A2U01_0113679, partial [Trifolium medium]|nr:hypothetical protein [Trifolium medium]